MITSAKRIEPLLKTVLVACQPLDVALTAYALVYLQGTQEMNPMLGWLATATPAAFVFFLMLKLGLAIKLYQGAVASVRDWAVLWVVVLLHAFAVTWNTCCVLAVMLS